MFVAKSHGHERRSQKLAKKEFISVQPSGTGITSKPTVQPCGIQLLMCMTRLLPRLTRFTRSRTCRSAADEAHAACDFIRTSGLAEIKESTLGCIQTKRQTVLAKLDDRHICIGGASAVARVSYHPGVAAKAIGLYWCTAPESAACDISAYRSHLRSTSLAVRPKPAVSKYTNLLSERGS